MTDSGLDSLRELPELDSMRSAEYLRIPPVTRSRRGAESKRSRMPPGTCQGPGVDVYLTRTFQLRKRHR
ncbi:hypothetical protein CRI77_09015 [Mycolicibacterium duvalii]|uniref:Uncharacterized protein n=1 Tax=Mycolicibacterium duvalii TaxID=39688 RepID=A0A7I7JWN9_9MYCO|nr:hypothetical protein CRI77_09015 [Mycolicibacterium duvalii]BBX16267.1 hypothetical protein MDUV_11270 [Mycolicibacterium duvalii]